MARKTKLQTLAKALLAAAEPELLAHTLRNGLKGNRVIAVDSDRHRNTVIVRVREKPEREFSERFWFDNEGVLLGDGAKPAGKKLAATLENAVPLEAAAEAENWTGRRPFVPHLMEVIRGVRAFVEEQRSRDPQCLSRMSGLNVGATFDKVSYGLLTVSEVIDPVAVAMRMNAFTYGAEGQKVSVGVRGQRIVLADGDGRPLATVGGTDGTASVSVVAEHAVAEMFRAAVLALDADLDLVGRRAARQAALREEQRLASKRRVEEMEAQVLASATSYLERFRVAAGQTFVVHRPSYDGDDVAVYIAERDLDAADFAEIIEGRLDGLARDADTPAFLVYPQDAARIRRAMDRVAEARGEPVDDDAPRPE